MRSTRIVIHEAAVRHNYQRLRQWSGDGFFCPMLKANGYGHGDVAIARILEKENCTHIGVAHVEEGVHLREAGIRMDILVFEPLNEESAGLVVKHRLTPVLGRLIDLDILAALKKRPEVHLKFNTGMQRLGFRPEELDSLRRRMKELSLKCAGVCTHLTHGDDVNNPNGPTAKQLEMFLQMADGWSGVRHAFKSASLLTFARTSRVHPEIGSRPGIALYGLPFDNGVDVTPLKPCLELRSQLARVHEVETGQGVSYSSAWKAPRRSWIGVVPIGYGDGYMRALSNVGEMLFRGRRVPIVGRVCMDYTMIDLTEACAGQPPQAGEDIVLIGRQGSEEITADDLARRIGTISYEIVTALSARLRREVV